MSTHRKSFNEQLIDSLKSLQVVIGVIVVIIILSVLGTIVPQQQSLSEDADMIIQNRSQINEIISSNPAPWNTILAHISLNDISSDELELYIQKYGQLRFVIIKILGITDIYNTWYYNLLILWVGISAIVCTYYRFLNVIKSSKRLTRRSLVRGWSSFFLHSSLVLLLFSGVVNKLFGVSSYITLNEAEATPVVIDPKSGKNWVIQLLLSNVTKPQHFDLKLDKFEIPLEKLITRKESNTKTNKTNNLEESFDALVTRDFISSLELRDNGNIVKGTTSMNRPFSYKGIQFFQMSYQLSARMTISDHKNDTVRQLPMTLNLPVQAGDEGYIEIPPGSQPTTATDPVFELIALKSGEIWQGNKKIGMQSPLAQVNIYNPATGKLSQQSWVTTTDRVVYKDWDLKMVDKVEYQSILSYKSAPADTLLYFSIGLLILSSSVLTFTGIKI